jgi:type II secretory pathway pseudopilin PulG
MIRRGFTLVEILLATILAALLLGGVLAVASSISRDAARATVQVPPMPVAARLLRFDFTNAQSIQIDNNGQTLTLIGNNALDPQSLLPNQRLARVTYTIDPRTRALAREQRYLDDEVHPEPWIELVAQKVTQIDVSSASDTGDQTIHRNLVVTIHRQAGDVNLEVHPR